MDSFPSSPPVPVRADLAVLRASLDQSGIPPRSLDRNVVIGAWNIRGFGKVLDKWESAATDSPKRNLRNVLCLAEVVSRFDVVALQLTLAATGRAARVVTPRQRLAAAFQELLLPLGDRRLAHLQPSRDLDLGGLALQHAEHHGELLIGCLERLATQPASPPWSPSSDTSLRCPGNSDALHQAFTSTGLRPAPGHASLPRTIFQDPEEEHFYDQIAWFVKPDGSSALTPPLRYDRLGGNFDFRPALQGQQSNTSLSWRISDHFPLWASISVRRE